MEDLDRMDSQWVEMVASQPAHVLFRGGAERLIFLVSIAVMAVTRSTLFGAVRSIRRGRLKGLASSLAWLSWPMDAGGYNSLTLAIRPPRSGAVRTIRRGMPMA